MNKSEAFVYKLCAQSFFSLWSYSNPKGKKNKELCDILVICDPDIIIFSVKEIKFKDTANFSIDWNRWERKAVEKSINQIYGAERWIKKATHVITKEGIIGLPFPDVSERRVHLIVVSLGSKGVSTLKYNDIGKNFVHVFDEVSINSVINELDTITDFVNYLFEKENLYKRGVYTLFEGGEEDLLAYYLLNNHKFPKKYEGMVLMDDLWKGYKKESREIKKRLRISYFWDDLIKDFYRHFQNGMLVFGNSLEEVEMVLRVMAKENRFSRVKLSSSLIDFFEIVKQKRKIKVSNARFVKSSCGIGYVFVICPRQIKREERKEELFNRCFVIRGLFQNLNNIIGIATEMFENKKGHSMDALLFIKKNWTSEDQSRFEYLHNEIGYFKK